MNVRIINELTLVFSYHYCTADFIRSPRSNEPIFSIPAKLKAKSTVVYSIHLTFTSMNSSFSEKQLLERFQNVDFVVHTQAQIVKDFERSGFTVDLSVENPLTLEELTLAVEKSLTAVMLSGETKMLQLLYQIDLPQEHFLSLIKDPHFLSKMALLIVQREAQKVYLRSIF